MKTSVCFLKVSEGQGAGEDLNSCRDRVLLDKLFLFDNMHLSFTLHINSDTHRPCMTVLERANESNENKT